MNFEIIAAGFDGSTDATDDRVLWVSAPNRAFLDWVLEGITVQSISDLPLQMDPQDLDYLLPGQAAQLADHLRDYEP